MKKILLQFMLISAFPVLFITLVWIITIGSFHLLHAIHETVTIVCTIVSIIVALCMLAAELDKP